MCQLDNAAQLINSLKFHERGANEGRGVACVRHIILDLERGDIRGAQATAQNESDKIRAYPLIERTICQELVELHGKLFPCPHKL